MPECRLWVYNAEIFSGGSSNLWKPVGFVAKQNSDFWFFWDTLIDNHTIFAKYRNWILLILQAVSSSIDYDYFEYARIRLGEYLKLKTEQWTFGLRNILENGSTFGFYRLYVRSFEYLHIICHDFLHITASDKNN